MERRARARINLFSMALSTLSFTSPPRPPVPPFSVSVRLLASTTSSSLLPSPPSRFEHLIDPRYCYRLILNEALSFGVLGATGRGLTEMHGVDVREIEIVTMSMAHSLASVGGLCIGTTQVKSLLVKAEADVEGEERQGSSFLFLEVLFSFLD